VNLLDLNHKTGKIKIVLRSLYLWHDHINQQTLTSKSVNYELSLIHVIVLSMF